MRILFVTWRYALRRFSGVVSALAAEGHEVVVAYPARGKGKLPKKLRDVDGIRLRIYDEIGDDEYGHALSILRLTRDYAWYLSPDQQIAAFNRRRALRNLARTAGYPAARGAAAWPDPVVSLEPKAAAALDAKLGELDRRLPADAGVLHFVESERPDVVLVSPLVRQKTQQTEVVKAARELGIPSALLTYSWDSLSNKGRIHVPPDRVLAWNEVQRDEATALHGVDAASVVVTGAPHWDRFFEREPSLTREELYRQHGFDPGEPLVLYLGSTNEVCPDESAVVDGWLQALRASAGPLRRVNVLIRRHPNEAERWSAWRPGFDGVSLSARPTRTSQGLFDELTHAGAVVGLNTSAQIEASIVGRPVYTFSAGAAAPAQGGSRHFYYLLEDSGGVVTFAGTLDEHVRQLERGLAGDYDREAIRRFVESFVRPHGGELPVTPIVCEAILALARSELPVAS